MAERRTSGVSMVTEATSGSFRGTEAASGDTSGVSEVAVGFLSGIYIVVEVHPVSGRWFLWLPRHFRRH